MADSSDPIEQLRQKLLPRGPSSFGGLSRTFKKLTGKTELTLNFEGFVKGLTEFGVSMEAEEAKVVFEKFDQDGSGTLNLTEFMSALRPPMAEIREQTIIEVFQKVDKAGDGEITLEDLKGIYDPTINPRISKKDTKQQDHASLNFLKVYESYGDKDGKLNLEEFLNFYAGVSVYVSDDDIFIQMVKSVWKV